MSVAAPITINNGAYRDANREHDYAADGFDGVVPITEYATEHQLTFRVGDAEAGTVALTAVPLGSTAEEVITDEAGDAVVFTVAAGQKTIRITGVFEQFVLTPDEDVDGTFFTDATGWLG